MTKLTSIICLLLIFLNFSNIYANTITINISGIKPNGGTVLIGIFKNVEQFPDGKPNQRSLVKSITNTGTSSFIVPTGKYAIGVFQDRNNNKILDKNFFGIPKEKYGFSGRKVFGKPSFSDAAIEI